MQALTKLTKLALDENQLSELPCIFNELTNLKDLSVSKNKLVSIDNDALKPLVNLVLLDLHQNNFNGVF